MSESAYPIEGQDYWIQYKQLPYKIFAFVHSHGDGTYTVFLDPRRSHDQQMSDLKHEINHIIRDDMYSERSVREIERE